MAIPSQGSIPSPIGRLLAWAFVLVLVVALASQFLSGSDDEVRVPTSTISPATTTATITPPAFWMNKYEWALKHHIDALATLKDCSELHDRYVQATLANSAVTQRYGSGTADLLEYIFLASEAVGCYG